MADEENKAGTVTGNTSGNDDLYSLLHDNDVILPPGTAPKQKMPEKKGPGFFKRHKKLWVVLSILIVFLTIVRFSLPYLIVYSVNNYGSCIIGTKVSLGDVDLGWLKGSIGFKDLRLGTPNGLQGKQFVSVSLLEFNLWRSSANIQGLTVANPKGFRDKNILTLVDFSIDLKFFSLFGKKLEIRNISVDGLDFYFEPVSKGKNNIETLMDYVAKTFQKKSEKKSESDKKTDVQIENIFLKNITLHARALKGKASFDQGVSVWAEKINILLKKGEADAENITIANPAGYFETHILTLKQIKAALDTESFSQEKLRIRKFHINDLDFYFEASVVNSSTNVGELQAYVDTVSKPGKKKKEEEKETKLQIDDLSLTDIDVHTVIVRQKATLPIVDIIRKDLGTKPEGITSPEVILVVLEELAEGATLVIGENAKKIGNDIKDSATKTIEQGTNEIKTQIDSLKSLFE